MDGTPSKEGNCWRTKTRVCKRFGDSDNLNKIIYCLHCKVIAMIICISDIDFDQVFGGGKDMLDTNIKRIVDSGPFTIEQAEWALNASRNNHGRAIKLLRQVRFLHSVYSKLSGYRSFTGTMKRFQVMTGTAKC